MDTWMHSTPNAQLPPFAVVGGHDCDGSPIYVGRSYHEGDNLPAKVIPSKGSAYVCFGGVEIVITHYEVLVGQGYNWVPCFGGAVPPTAVRSGTTRNGEPLYVGRGRHINSLTVGKIQPSHGCLYIPFGGQEVRISQYEVLVRQYRVANEQQTQPGWSIDVKTEVKPSIYPVLQASTEMYPPPPPYSLLPAKPFTYTPLVVAASTFTPAESHKPPQTPIFSPAPSAPSAFTPATSYQPPPTSNFTPTQTHNPAFTNSADVWVPVSGSHTPSNAVQAGHSIDLSKFFVARAFHAGDLIPGKAVPTQACAYISYMDRELPVTNYEILVGNNYDWVPTRDGNIAPGAVEAGYTRAGETLYVGRSYFNGNLVPGKIQKSHRCLYIAHGGSHRLNDYEVLVRRNSFYSNQAHQMLY